MLLLDAQSALQQLATRCAVADRGSSQVHEHGHKILRIRRKVKFVYFQSMSAQISFEGLIASRASSAGIQKHG
jgi:hypothetical protein